MNRLEKAIALVSPRVALRRFQYRMAFDMAEKSDKRRRYEAASNSRRTDNWFATGASGSAEMHASLATLRNRARDMFRNNAYASRAVNVITSNTIGAGIKPTPKGKGRDIQKIKTLWDNWSEEKYCDFEGVQTIYGIQALVMRTVAQSGECLIRVHRLTDSETKKNGGIPIRLQIMEGDFLDTTHDVTLDTDGGYTMQGIKFDKNGGRVGYWLWNRHPGDVVRLSELYSKFVPAESVAHIYKVERPGQARGVPFGVSAMLRLRDFDEYEDAQLIRQKIAACFAVFVTDSNDAVAGAGDTNTDLRDRVEPGIIESLPPGKTVTMANPPGTQGYGEYARKQLQAVAAAYGVTYEAMTGDLSGVNFSSGRMGWLEMHRLINEWQTQMIIPQLCAPVWTWFVDACNIAGIIKSEKIEVTWTPPRREMIDPVKEVKGMLEEVRAGFNSWQAVVRSLGNEPATVIAEIAADFALFKSNGLMLTTDPRYDTTRTGPAPEETQAPTPAPVASGATDKGQKAKTTK